MTIEQKARETAERVEEEHGSYWGLPEAARLGIIEGRKEALEQAAKMMEELAVAFRELIEEQKL